MQTLCQLVPHLPVDREMIRQQIAVVCEHYSHVTLFSFWFSLPPTSEGWFCQHMGCHVQLPHFYVVCPLLHYWKRTPHKWRGIFDVNHVHAKTSPANLIYNYSMQSPRVPDCRYDNPCLQSKLAKSHIYAPLVSNCTCWELVYKWTQCTVPSGHIRHFNPGSKLLLLVLFLKLSTAATDLRLMQRLIIWYLIF